MSGIGHASSEKICCSEAVIHQCLEAPSRISSVGRYGNLEPQSSTLEEQRLHGSLNGVAVGGLLPVS